MSDPISRIVITGACGNLGWKLMCDLVQLPEVVEIVGISLEPPTAEQLEELNCLEAHAKALFVQADLTNPTDVGWLDVIGASHAVVHFAAQNPFPEATWNDATHSLDMTLNLANAAVASGVRRFVFASSNHVMGRYKDSPLSESIGAGQLTTSLEHAVGTVWDAGDVAMDSTVYAVAKSAGERACRALATQADSHTEFVSLRIGWCQPGENLPSTLSSAGTPTQGRASSNAADAQATQNDRWFKSMWLSNRDFLQLCRRALFAGSEDWPEPNVVVNAMSRNEDMPWSLAEAESWLGYQPEDGLRFS